MRSVELKPLLTVETVKGRILSLDALHTQREFSRTGTTARRRLRAHSQRESAERQEDIADLFEDRTPDRRRWQQAETWDTKGMGG